MSGTYNFVLDDAACHSRCVFCGGRDMGDIGANVDNEKRKIRSILAEGKIDQIDISGNDPMGYGALADVIVWLKETAPGARVTLATNGRDLVQGLTALLLVGLDELRIPVYGATSEIHDSVTGVVGSFEQTLSGVRAAMSEGMDVRLHTLVLRQNAHVLVELFTFLGGICPSFGVGVPLFFRGERPPYALTGAELRDSLRSGLNALATQTSAVAWLKNIPACIAPPAYGYLQESRPPPRGYEHMRGTRPARRLEVLSDGSVLPDYQLMAKGAECAECVVTSDCRGFYQSYIDAQLFSFEPISACAELER